MENLRRNEKGITLIALVVTIVVLLILAGVSISMLAGENGIIKKAQESKEETEQAKVEELVTLAIDSLIVQNLGLKDGITPEMVANEVNKMENRDDVTAEKSTFPTNILFEEEDRKVGVNIELGVVDSIRTPIFSSVEGWDQEELIAEADKNMDLFEYEIINQAETASVNMDSLPTKEARITSINPLYCNRGGYTDSENGITVEDTNYGIIYKGEEITDTLVVPYQVEIDGEMYKITEANIGVDSEYDIRGLPDVKTIIYPNVIKRIYGGDFEGALSHAHNLPLQTVILPEDLVIIGDSVFQSCSRLTSIEIPSSVTSIGDEAFLYCSGLTSIEIPSSVTSIGNSTFRCCSGLTSIEISSSVTSIGDGAFYGTAWYDNQQDGNIYINNVYYEYKGTMPTGTQIKIKEGTKQICARAFSGCSGLTSIEIPSSVISIGDEAFFGCTGLTNIEIPSSVTSIGYSAFGCCSGLTSIEIPTSVTSIGNFAFSGCTGLTNIEIPSSVTSIGYSAFGHCSGLTSIEIPSSVTSIGECVFSYCSGLISIEIPTSVTRIWGEAFSGCSGLMNVNYKGTKEQWNQITIGTDNEYLTSATINYNYTGE